MDGRIADLLDQLARQMGVAVEYLWPAMVAYTRANALTVVIVNATALFGLVVLGIVAGGILRRLWQADTERWKDIMNRGSWSSSDAPYADGYVFGAGLGSIAVGIVTIIALANITSALPALIAPEGATVLNLVKAAGGRP